MKRTGSMKSTARGDAVHALSLRYYRIRLALAAMPTPLVAYARTAAIKLRLRNRIAEHLLYLIRDTVVGVLPMGTQECDREAYVSDAYDVMFNCIERFDPDRPKAGRLTTFVVFSVQRHIWRVRTRTGGRPPHVSIDGNFPTPGGPDPADARDEAEVLDLDARRVREAVATLDRRERAILASRFEYTGHRPTLALIGREHGITKERVRQIEAKALLRVKGELSRTMAG